MTPWQIIGVSLGGLLIFLLFLLFFGRAGIRVVYRDKPRVILSVLGIGFTLYPKKQKKSAERRLTVCKNPDHLLAEEMRSARIARKKLRKEQEKAARKAAKKAAKKEKKKKAAAALPPEEKLGPLDHVSCILALLKEAIRRTRGKLKISVHRFRVVLASDDAAKTALMYGTVLQSATFLFQWIETHYNHLHRHAGDMEISTDYTEKKPSAEIDLSISLTFLRALIIAGCVLHTYEVTKERRLTLRRLRKKKKDQRKLQKKQKKECSTPSVPTEGQASAENAPATAV